MLLRTLYFVVEHNSFVMHDTNPEETTYLLNRRLSGALPDMVFGHNPTRGENARGNFRGKHLENDPQIAIVDSRLLQGRIFVPRLERILLSFFPFLRPEYVDGRCTRAIHLSKLDYPAASWALSNSDRSCGRIDHFVPRTNNLRFLPPWNRA